MPNTVIVRPNNTPEEEKIILQNIANVMEKIIQAEYGVKVKIDLYKKY